MNQLAAKMSVPDKQINEDYQVELLALRGAGKRTTGVLNLVSAICIYWRLIVKYHTIKVHILGNYSPMLNTVCVTKLRKPQTPIYTEVYTLSPGEVSGSKHGDTSKEYQNERFLNSYEISVMSHQT